MSRPLLLDLFCGAGGAAMGYHRAGFDVVGVDINAQRNYPFEFLQEDAVRLLERFVWHQHDGRTRWFSGRREPAAIHASPPCQHYSAMSTCRPGLSDDYPDLVGLTRELLDATGLPYVIENVVGSPLRDPITLCGQVFGFEIYRHRLFEASFDLPEPDHLPHVIPASKAGHWKPGTYMSVAGHVAPIAKAREIMDIDWMTRDELTEAIPPYYTEYIGTQLLQAIRTAA